MNERHFVTRVTYLTNCHADVLNNQQNVVFFASHELTTFCYSRDISTNCRANVLNNHQNVVLFASHELTTFSYS